MNRFFHKLSKSIKKRIFFPKIVKKFIELFRSGDESICFVVAQQNKGYILDRMAKEIGAVFKYPIYHYDKKYFPKVSKYFVTHYSLLEFVLAEIDHKIIPINCLFTHDKGNLDRYVEMLNLCEWVIAESREGVDTLIKYGVKKELLKFVPECADRKQFPKVERKKEGLILVCGTNYADERKNPQLIKQIVEALPHKHFILLGKDWDDFASFKNVTIGKTDYKDYWSIYKECTVYLSCSKLEGGGPNSLIEAMHTNIVPVVSDTGNARDYIQHGKNGFIFSLNSGHEEVVKLIEKAYEFDADKNNSGRDISETVTKFTWKSYGYQVKKYLQLKKS